MEACMDTRYLVDPELLPGLEDFRRIQLSADLLPLAREGAAEMLAATPPPPVPGVTTTRTTVPGPQGAPDVAVEVSRPSTTGPVPAVLWIHGGGYVLGSAEQDRPKAERFAAELGHVVVSVDYRLAPETPYPGPVEDCCAALTWLHDNAAGLGVDPDRLVVAGESAGGGLAAAVALLARDRDRVPLRLQALVYPMVDDRTAVDPDLNPYTGEFVWTPGSNHFGWSALLGREPGGPDVPGYAAPARAGELAGLPPAFVGVGGLDLFLEEDMEYARRLQRAGVPTELHVYPGAYHGFWRVPAARVARTLQQDIVGAIARATVT
jgi:acetyl esterase/lipase